MNKKTNDNPFGNFAGTTVGAPEVARWEFPGIGYNATTGTFYVGEEQAPGLTLVPLAYRQCKETTDVNGATHRYPVNHPRKGMVAPDEVTYRLQVACVVNEEIHVFGARSWTARASWLNPRGGQYRDEKFPTGIWYVLEDFIKQAQAQHGVATTPLCWELELAPGSALTVGTGKNTSKATPIIMTKAPAFVGAERVARYTELYVEQELSDWVNEWKKTAVTEDDAEEDTAQPAPEPAPFNLPGSVPF